MPMPWEIKYNTDELNQFSDYSKVEAAKNLQKTAEDVGIGEALLIGAGREFDKLGAGIANEVDKKLSRYGSDSATERVKRRADEQSEKDRTFKPLSDLRPISTTTGGFLPYLATIPFEIRNAARTAAARPTHTAERAGDVFRRFAGMIGRETGIGAAQGAAHYDDTALSGAAWGAGGALMGDYIGKLVGGTPNPNPELNRIINFAKDNDLFIPPGMATGNRRLQQLDKAMETYPMTADKFKDRLEASKQAENRIISAELGGDPADYLSADYLETQRDRISNNMDRLVANTTGQFDQNHAYGITDIIDRFRSTEPSGNVPNILRDFENQVYTMAGAGTPLTGEAFEAFTRRLNSASRKQFGSATGDRYLGHALSDINEIFSDAIGTGMGNRAEWDQTRRQFALLNGIEKAKLQNSSKSTPGVAGYVDTQKLAKAFPVSENIRRLAEVEALRKAQPPNSLSTSGMLARTLSQAVHSPAQAMGTLSLLTSRATKGVAGLDDLLTSVYLKGWPHATGLAPFAGRHTAEVTRRGIPRMLAADQEER